MQLAFALVFACAPVVTYQDAEEEEVDQALLARRIELFVEDPSVASPDEWRYLAVHGDDEGLAAVIEHYAAGANSPGDRARVLHALADVAPSKKRGPIALDFVMDRARRGTTRVEQLAAMDALASAGEPGHRALGSIVKGALGPVSGDDAEAFRLDEWMIRAGFERYALGATPADYAEMRSMAGYSKAGDELTSVREVPSYARVFAFETIADRLGNDELEDAFEDPLVDVRIKAFNVLADRGLEVAFERAKDLLEDDEADPIEQMAAVPVISRFEGEQASGFYFDLSRSKDIDRAVRMYAATFVIDDEEDYVAKNDLRKRLGSTRTDEVFFALASIRERPVQTDFEEVEVQEGNEEKIDKQLIKLLRHKDDAISALAASGLRLREARIALDELELRIKKSKDPARQAKFLDTFGALFDPGDRDQFEVLVESANSEEEPLRYAAVAELLARDPAGYEDVLTRALSSEWPSERLAAIFGLRWRRWDAGVGFLVRALPELTGRSRMLCAEALMELTGREFNDHALTWQSWWEDAAANFRLPEEEDPEDAEAEQAMEEEDMTQAEIRWAEPGIANLSAFGLPISAESLLIGIDAGDTSTEPLESVNGTRLDAACREALRCVGDLPPGTRFNVVTFGKHGGKLAPEPLLAGPESTELAKTFLESVEPGGGAEPFEEFRQELADPRFDTGLFVGTGTSGDEDGEDRLAFEVWNAHRLRYVYSVSLGPRSAGLMWIAADTDGGFVHAP